ncbi:hypothetical protein B0T21DRAFT_379461 [Apiosordaria backusii]|uniref:Mitochondrial pyruvate carrier n=1 Tax=Apiosordaria backusii TaxID=314023 RepID=A0AA40EXK3_9PEZI|nr:hypothetical protein B0T21DRAFT_379461 [Apiosordaria backusii]
MAAALIKAANAKIRSNPWTDYFCSTHFWGPASNFTIPLAAVADTQKSPDLISGKMTGALIVYAFTFMRFSVAIRPKNYLLFGCHSVNATAQSIQGYRFVDWHYWGGKEKKLLVEKEATAKGKLVQADPAVVVKKDQSGDNVRKK